MESSSALSCSTFCSKIEAIAQAIFLQRFHSCLDGAQLAQAQPEASPACMVDKVELSGVEKPKMLKVSPVNKVEVK